MSQPSSGPHGVRHPVTYQGRFVAIAGPERFWFVGSWADGRAPGAPLVRFITFMCIFNQQIEQGRVQGPFTSELAERWARLALIDDEVLLANPDVSNDALAERLSVPSEQVTARRQELALGGRNHEA